MTPTEESTKFSKLSRTQFVWRYGVLGWGATTAILFSLLMGFQGGWDGFVFKLIPALVLFPLGGILWGRFMWTFLENKHNRVVSEQFRIVVAQLAPGVRRLHRRIARG